MEGHLVIASIAFTLIVVIVAGCVAWEYLVAPPADAADRPPDDLM